MNPINPDAPLVRYLSTLTKKQLREEFMRAKIVIEKCEKKKKKCELEKKEKIENKNEKSYFSFLFDY
tara:strand:+ start:3426 stop:3626 length:201 start_codon:yes stop_codon:yes gene_type:complete